MEIKPVSTKKKLLYSVGVLCASLTSCDDNPFRCLMGRQSVPGSVPNDNPPTEPNEIPQALGGDVPYIPSPEDELEKEDSQPDN